MRVAGAGEGCLLHGRRLGTSVPEQDLARVCAADDEVRMKRGELRRQNIRLRVEDELGPVVEIQVPHLDNTVGIMWCGGVLGVGGEEQLGKLGREVDAADHALLGPPLVVELDYLLNPSPTFACGITGLLFVILNVIHLQRVVGQDVVFLIQSSLDNLGRPLHEV
jgi:hypothetical protein